MLQPVAKVVETLYTVFWHKWPVHDLVLVIPPPPLVKSARNSRPCSKLEGTTLNGGGGVSGTSHRCKKATFSLECLNSFAAGCTL